MNKKKGCVERAHTTSIRSLTRKRKLKTYDGNITKSQSILGRKRGDLHRFPNGREPALEKELLKRGECGVWWGGWRGLSFYF